MQIEDWISSMRRARTQDRRTRGRRQSGRRSRRTVGAGIVSLESRLLLTTIDLAALSPTDGTVIYGVEAGDEIGGGLSIAGDVNGDGYDDLIISAPFGDAAGNSISNAGDSYIVFGGPALPGIIDLASPDSAGVTLYGADVNGHAWSAAGLGDVNGDGCDDVLVGSGQKGYLIFGGASLPSTIDLAALGSAGVTLLEADPGDGNGWPVSGAGDINGDGFHDLLVGARTADSEGNSRPDAGESYVIFGGAALPSVIDLADLGSAGMTIFGIEAGDRSGAVASAGDVNGDGYDDLFVGATGADGPGNVRPNAGESYLIFGGASLPLTLDLANLGSAGITLFGAETDDGVGTSLTGGGDVNGDGYDDLLIDAVGADAAGNGKPDAGEAYLVFGGPNLPSTIDLSSLATAGITIFGADAGDRLGGTVSIPGDVNGDGFDDIVISAADADAAGNAKPQAGETYVIFGGASLPTTIDLADPGSADITIYGADAGDLAGGRSVKSVRGDVNGDGFDDIVISAYFADGVGNAVPNAGDCYVIYGRDFTATVTHAGTAAGETLTGDAAANVIVGGRGSDTLIGNGGVDVLLGGQGDDVLAVSDPGFGRLVGGTGTDTLRLDGSGMWLDLVTLPDNRLLGIEAIDIRGSGDNTLTLNVLEVLKLSDESNTLVVHANSGDRVRLDGGWTRQADEIIDSVIYRVMTQGRATLKVASGASLITTFIDLAKLTPAEGTIVYGADPGDNSGYIVRSAGDMNGDGFDDTVITARYADAAGNGKSRAGEAYIIFGEATLPSTIDLAGPGAADITIFGASDDDLAGVAASSAGDVNGDGFDDVIIGAHYADGPGDSRPDSGESYVIFGGATLPSTIDLASLGSAGVVIFGAEADDKSGISVSGAGDVNGDGFYDILIGANGADAPGNSRPEAGESYLIFGAANLPATIDLANPGDADVTIFGADASDTSGTWVSVSNAGDVNGDGFDDLIVGANRAGAAGNLKPEAGEAYVVFGAAALPSAIDLAGLGAAGVTIFGVDPGDRAGSVNTAGDINGDGFDDLLIGARNADAAGNLKDSAGETYVVFGGATLPLTIDLESLGTAGITISGADAGDFAGWIALTAGDVNGDGFDDFVIGSAYADGLHNARDEGGDSYLIFGGLSLPSIIDLADLGESGITIFGAEAGDWGGGFISGAGDLNSDGFADLLIGAMRASSVNNARPLAGESYIIFGGTFAEPGPTHDFGDAPDSGQSGFAGTYPVAEADDGARHVATGPVLGALRDPEHDGLHSANADGDDTIGGPDDEDGVAFTVNLIVSPLAPTTGTVDVDLQNADPISNRLDAWLDFNRDGDWDDPGEQIFTSFDLGTSAGIQSLNFTIPQDTGTNVELGLTFARFRLSTAGGLSVTGAAPDGEVEDSAVALYDNAFSFSLDDGSMSENGGLINGTVNLLVADPFNDTIVPLVSSDPASASVPPTVTIPAGQLTAAFQVTAVDNDVLDGDRIVTLTAGFGTIAPDQVDLTVTDYETLTVVLSKSRVAENAGPAAVSGTVTRSNTDNAAPLIVNLLSSDPTEAVVLATMTIPGGSASGAFDIDAIDDALLDGTILVAISASAAGYVGGSSDLDIRDNEAARISVVESGGSTVVGESGFSDSFTVVLTEEPDADVVLTLSFADASEIALPVTTLTFTPFNWFNPQTVDVDAVDDIYADGAKTVPITIAVNDALSDVFYSGTADVEVSSVNQDNEVVGLIIEQSGNHTEMPEVNGRDSVTVRLIDPPESNVVILVSISNAARARVSTASLLFTDGDWDEPQEVDVESIDDGVVDAEVVSLLEFAPDPEQSDDGFDPMPTQSINVLIVDDEEPGFESPGSDGRVIVLDEGGSSATIPVQLLEAPELEVVIIATPSDLTEVMITPAFLVFNTSNWNILQYFTVTGVDDAGWDGEQVSYVTVAIDGPGSQDQFDLLPPIEFEIRTTDNEPALPQLTGPASDTRTSYPTFTWTPTTGAVGYRLWVNNSEISGPPIIDTIVAGTSYTSPVPLEIAWHRAWIQATFSDGSFAPWSPPRNFRVRTNPVIQPLARYQGTARPTIEWSPVYGAASYEIQIDNRFTAPNGLIRESGLTSTSYTVPIDLPLGLYRVWVRAWATNGNDSAWSAPSEFYIAVWPDLLAPGAAIFDTTPTFRWSAVAGAREYSLRVIDTATQQVVIDVSGLSGREYTPAAALAKNPHRWYVRGAGDHGVTGLWSHPQLVSIGGRTTVLTPVGPQSGSQPAFTWQKVDDAFSYSLYIMRTDGGGGVIEINNLTTNSWNPPGPLAAGNYRVWVRAISQTGTLSLWSLPVNFEIVAGAFDTMSPAEDPGGLFAGLDPANNDGSQNRAVPASAETPVAVGRRSSFHSSDAGRFAAESASPVRSARPSRFVQADAIPAQPLSVMTPALSDRDSEEVSAAEYDLVMTQFPHLNWWQFAR